MHRLTHPSHVPLASYPFYVTLGAKGERCQCYGFFDTLKIYISVYKNRAKPFKILRYTSLQSESHDDPVLFGWIP